MTLNTDTGMLPYDPADGEAFWEALRGLEGFPHGETIPLRYMLFSSGALLALPGILKDLSGSHQPGTVLLVQDPTPMQRAGEALKPLVAELLRAAGWTVEVLELIPDESGGVHTTLPQIERVRAALRPGLAVVGLGSGAVADIAKHACFLHSGEALPLALVQTANSVSAFTSNMAPVFVEGVKRTLPSRYPDALICDLETLQSAPSAMTAAGVGDLLAAFVSFADWRLAHLLGMEDHYSPLPETLMGDLESILYASAAAIRERTPQGMATLAKLIALAGLAMSLTHSTAPLSGSEHLISHLLDLQAELQGRPLALHGAQVACAAVLAAGDYQEMLANFDPASLPAEALFPTAEAMRARVLGALAQIDPSGRAGEECWADYGPKLSRWNAKRSEVTQALAHWPQHRAELTARALPPVRLQALMEAVALPADFDGLVPPPPDAAVRFAHDHAALMRRRFTLADLREFLRGSAQGGQ